ncbi:hypothetical protein [Pelagerythrobacter aerophilus]|uniref:hypothetical protein n=1 Tax=Pelagerythrobacter aerophilus TaxID=2306995 RepID=UPI0011C3CA9F|nr:hypothetical protein [Pelagerythrobacter aerophilus]
MSDDHLRYWGAGVTAVISMIFLWYFYQGLKLGTVTIPLRHLDELLEWDRGETMYWFAIGANFIGGLAAAWFSYSIWSGAI